MTNIVCDTAGCLLRVFAFLVLTHVALCQETATTIVLEIQSTEGNGNPMSISVHGVAHEPTPLRARWDAADSCLSDSTCYVQSWLAANTSGDLQRIVLLRYPAERTTLQNRITKEPSLLINSTNRFKTIKSWGVLGWLDYGPFRVMLLIREDERSRSLYALPLRRSGTNWTQTDSLAEDRRAFALLDVAGDELMRKYLGGQK